MIVKSEKEGTVQRRRLIGAAGLLRAMSRRKAVSRGVYTAHKGDTEGGGGENGNSRRVQTKAMETMSGGCASNRRKAFGTTFKGPGTRSQCARFD